MATNICMKIKQLPKGLPSESDFYLTEEPIPRPGDGEILVHTEFLALDPYVRALMSGRHFLDLPESGQVFPARGVATVVESEKGGFSPGQSVLLETGMQSYCVSKAEDARVLNISPAPLSAALGVLGMPGLTAYAGLTQVAKIQPGETVLVSAASGAVGSMVIQIATQMGCHGIGIAGGAEKCRWVKEHTDAVDCLDYKEANITERLKALRPLGVDVYLDNMGGDMLNTVVSSHLARDARIVLCGLISQYNLEQAPPGPNLGPLMGARAKILPLIVYDFEHLWDEFEQAAVCWFEQGKIQFLEDRRQGIENAPAHFCRLMRGENMGKTVIQNTHSH